MGEYTRVEIAVGMFVILGLSGLAYLSVSIGGATLFPSDRYEVSARFATVGDLAAGAVVKLAGVPVGEVRAIGIDRYAAAVSMRIDRSLELPKDTIASIKTEGLLGEAYVSLSPGASLENLGEGGRIAQTEPPLDLFELVEKYAFDSDDGPTAPPDDADSAATPDADGAAPKQGEARSPFPDPLE